jgi:leader peptidase (prepilin peptidase)/N-methyltransferase
MTLAELPLNMLRGFAVFFGLIWGSFLNVVIYRVPRDLSVVHPGSSCPSCKKPIAFYDNIPIVSFLVLRGRTRCCKTKMSPRYPLVEALGGIASVALFELVIRNLPSGIAIQYVAGIYLSYFALMMALIAAAFIDFEHMILPDSINFGALVVGLATAKLRGLGYADSAFGGAVGFMAVWFPFIFLYRAVRGREGMGLGDAKLVLVAGIWFGWAGAAWTLLAGSMQGTLFAVAIYLAKGKIEEPEAVKKELDELRAAAKKGDREAKKILEEDPLGEEPEEGFGKQRVAFGPFLILAMLQFLLFGEEILNVVRGYLIVD